MYENNRIREALFMEEIKDGVRLTWEEIKIKYPAQWVAMKDVNFKDGHLGKVESGIVVLAGEDHGELLIATSHDDNIKVRHTDLSIFSRVCVL